MSSYKSNIPRRTTESTTEPTANPKLQEKVSKLQELFHTWSSDDLQSVLAETGGDVELAATRISEGHAEQWGSVTRKKEKKPQHSHQTSGQQSSRSDRERHTGESRGGRGGRGGRGRSTSGRGASRAPTHSSHHQFKESISNSTSPATSGAATSSTANERISDISVPNGPATSAEPKTDASGAGAETSIPSIPSHHDSTHVKILDEPTIVSIPAEAPATVEPAFSIKPQPSSVKVSAGSKLSWAQIAKPQEKPKVTPPLPVVPQPSQPSTSTPAVPPAAAFETTPPLADLAESPYEASKWEEPTTVQAPPTWEEESISTLPAVLPQTPRLSENPTTTITSTTITTTTTNDGWISAEAVTSTLPTQDSWDTKPSVSAISPSAPTQESSWTQVQSTTEPLNTSTTADASTSPTSIAPPTSVASIPTPATSLSSKPSTPSVAHARPLGIHRSSAKFSKDQAVVISAFAGNIAPHTDRLGMQFGSLNLNGDDPLDSSTKLDSETASVLNPEVPKQQVSAQSQQAQVAVQTQPQESAQPTPPTSTTTHTSSNQHIFPQSAPHSAPPVAAPTQAPQIQQQATQTSQPLPSVTSFSSHPSVAPGLTLHQQQQQLAPQHQHTQPQHSYGHQQQNVHFDGPQLQGPHGTTSQNNSYFRPEPSFYHTPTPPQNAPDHQSSYPAAFSPVGIGAGLHGHSQSLGGQNLTHLGGFGGISGSEYGYNDGQRNFYDYVPSGFSSRLGHDESGKAGLPLGQGNQPSSVLNSAAGQTQNSNGHQSPSTQPPTGQQNQQGYPPMQFYYPPYFANTYHPPYPNASYSQPYVAKFPVYPQGPVGPGSAPSSKGLGGPYNPPGSQSHPYHGQGSFEDPTSGYSHHQSSTNLSSNEFQKQTPHHHQQPQQLYSGQPNQGLQNFLNMQQTAGAGQGVGAAGQSRSGTSPETAYKHYGGAGGGPDKPTGSMAQSNQQGRSAGVQQGQQQGGGSFYPGGRFGGTGGPQQQGQQQGYTQGSDQSQFYSYQHRHQAGYWQ